MPMRARLGLVEPCRASSYRPRPAGPRSARQVRAAAPRRCVAAGRADVSRQAARDPLPGRYRARFERSRFSSSPRFSRNAARGGDGDRRRLRRVDPAHDFASVSTRKALGVLMGEKALVVSAAVLVIVGGDPTDALAPVLAGPGSFVDRCHGITAAFLRWPAAGQQPGHTVRHCRSTACRLRFVDLW